MDRRLAALAGGVLAAAGAFGMLSRRHATTSDESLTVDIDRPICGDAEPAQEEPKFVVASLKAGAIEHPIDLDQAIADTQASGAPLPSPFFQSVEAADPRPLAEVLAEIVSGYPIDAGKMLDLRLALRDIGDAIDAGLLEEGTAVVDFDWAPAPGLLMNMAIAVLATRNYVRVNFCDLQGNLRAPELDVHIRGSDVRALPDTNARMVDLEERRSENVVTRLKLKAIKEGVQIHPGNAAAVLARCRIVGTPFTN